MIRLIKFPDFLSQVLQAHWRSLLILLLGVGFPALIFEQLAVAVWNYQGGFLWDKAVLLALHQTAHPHLDHLAVVLTYLGSVKTILPLLLIVSAFLLWMRRWRSLTYCLVAASGNMLINQIAKAFWHRVRPHFWDSILPEKSFAFPSGHAMTSMTVVAILMVLLWQSRWRWLALIAGSLYLVTIAWTRLYLGVHFPSDILAGWMVALAWAVGTGLIIRPHLISRSTEAASNPTEALLTEDTITQDEQQVLSS